MAQTFAALEAAYAKASAAHGGAFPSNEQVVDAMKGVNYEGHARNAPGGVERHKGGSRGRIGSGNLAFGTGR